MRENERKIAEEIFQVATRVNIKKQDAELTSTLILLDDALKAENSDYEKIDKIIRRLNIIGKRLSRQSKT